MLKGLEVAIAGSHCAWCRGLARTHLGFRMEANSQQGKIALSAPGGVLAMQIDQVNLPEVFFCTLRSILARLLGQAKHPRDYRLGPRCIFVGLPELRAAPSKIDARGALLSGLSFKKFPLQNRNARSHNLVLAHLPNGPIWARTNWPKIHPLTSEMY